jgi:TRAP-type mannitol/chloroaromatic compound transport system substrate-binding protein
MIEQPGGKMMSERGVAGVAAIAIAGGLAIGAAGESRAAEFSLVMQSTWPAGDAHHLGFERWAEQVELYTGGRVAIETLPAGAVVSAFEVLDAIHDHVIDGGHSVPSYWMGKNVALVIAGVGPAGPFGLDDRDFWGWAWLGGGFDLVNSVYQDDVGMNVVWLPVGSTGPQSLGWFKEELHSLDDLRGLRFRVGGIPSRMYEMLGASVVSLPGGEILPAGERGVIDAAQYVGPYVDLEMGFHDIWQYHYAPAYHETVTVLEVLFNKDVWDGFPEDIQNIIKLVSQEHHHWWHQHFHMNNKRAMDELTAQGVEFRRTPDDIMEGALDAWHEIMMDEYVNNPVFKRLADAQLEWASQVVVARRILDTDYKELADRYWAPGAFVESEERLDFDYKAPAYYDAFQ